MKEKTHLHQNLQGLNDMRPLVKAYKAKPYVRSQKILLDSFTPEQLAWAIVRLELSRHAIRELKDWTERARTRDKQGSRRTEAYMKESYQRTVDEMDRECVKAHEETKRYKDMLDIKTVDAKSLREATLREQVGRFNRLMKHALDSSANGAMLDFCPCKEFETLMKERGFKVVCEEHHSSMTAHPTLNERAGTEARLTNQKPKKVWSVIWAEPAAG